MPPQQGRGRGGMVGVGGFEPPTSRSRTVRSSLTELHPDEDTSLPYFAPCSSPLAPNLPCLYLPLRGKINTAFHIRVVGQPELQAPTRHEPIEHSPYRPDGGIIRQWPRRSPARTSPFDSRPPRRTIAAREECNESVETAERQAKAPPRGAAEVQTWRAILNTRPLGPSRWG